MTSLPPTPASGEGGGGGWGQTPSVARGLAAPVLHRTARGVLVRCAEDLRALAGAMEGGTPSLQRQARRVEVQA